MSWHEFIDGYDLKARVLPAAIILLPLVWTAYYLLPGILENPFLWAGSGLTWVALTYLATMCFRTLGVFYSKRLWRDCGGLPSTRMMRMRDRFLGQEQKSRIQIAVWNRFGIRLFSLAEERANPELADRRIVDAFREIKEALRQSGRSRLIDKHNAEYAFARNLCGSRMVLVCFAAIGAALCGWKNSEPHWRASLGCYVNIALLVAWLPLGWVILPRVMRLSADTYAERVWMTFLSVSSWPERKAPASVTVAVEEEAG